MIDSEMIERWAASIQAAAVKRNEELVETLMADLGAGCTDEEPWQDGAVRLGDGLAVGWRMVDYCWQDEAGRQLEPGQVCRSVRVDIAALPDDPREARQVLAAQMQLAGDQLWAVIQKRKGWDG